MTDEIEDLSDEELVEEYRDTVEFRTIESEEGQVSPKQINLQDGLRAEIIERIQEKEKTKVGQRMNRVYVYIQHNPECTYQDVLKAIGSNRTTIDALYYLAQKGAIYQPMENTLRVTDQDRKTTSYEYFDPTEDEE
jgi:hypothetical protein